MFCARLDNNRSLESCSPRAPDHTQQTLNNISGRCLFTVATTNMSPGQASRLIHYHIYHAGDDITLRLLYLKVIAIAQAQSQASWNVLSSELLCCV